eukprot:TRINITY_DN4205_c0_g1_i2.p1 TRINITY_DN4205_c0_g1~~TRINITY_DN4205_c0_g1_i2.p1  ORF type:complete len:304 (-),score=52.53 TRINITY_DN4205_c0_g1_i2:24-935(-)
MWPDLPQLKHFGGAAGAANASSTPHPAPMPLLRAPAPLVDIGANMLHSRLSDSESLLRRCVEANVTTVLITGTSIRDSQGAQRFLRGPGSAKPPGVALFATAGVHPHTAKTFNAASLGILKTLMQDPLFVAVGECGLDFDRDFSPRDVQEAVFRSHIELAVALQKPMFLHERNAHQRFLSIWREFAHPPQAVVHCFTGNAEELQTYLDMGFYIGLTGFICDDRRAAHLLPHLSKIPLDRLMIETDAPFMLPKNMPGAASLSRNEPAFLPHVAERLARARGISVEELCAATTATARRFFRLAHT